MSVASLLEDEETEANFCMTRELTRPDSIVGAPHGDEVKNEVNQEIMDKALEYVNHCRDHPKYAPEVIKRAVKLGDDLLRAAGTLEKAMRGLRLARQQVIGMPTAGATTDRSTPATSKPQTKMGLRPGDTTLPAG